MSSWMAPQCHTSRSLTRSFRCTTRVALLDLQEKRIKAEVEHLEADTGIKLRVLCQNYPDTPGGSFSKLFGS